MYQASKAFFAILLLSTGIFSSSATAKECYEPSPNLNDSYYNLDDTVKLTKQEKGQLKALFKRIRGKWQGRLAYTECRGSERSPRIITKTANVTAETSLVSSEKVTINAQKNYLKEGVKRYENFSLFNVKNIYSVIFPDDNTFIFSERYRRVNNYVASLETTKNKKAFGELKQAKQAKQAKKYKNPNEVITKKQTTRSLTSRITETIYEVTFHGNSISLLRSFYTNGVYTGEEKWSMTAN